MSIYPTSSSTETPSLVCSVIEKVISDTNLLTLILICIPAKSLLVFKSVSKQWLSLISDPIFATTHIRRQKPKPTGLFLRSEGFGFDNYKCPYDFVLLDGSVYEEGYRGKEVEEFLLLDGSEYQQGYIEKEKEVTDSGGGFKIPRKFGDDPEPGKYGLVGEFGFWISSSCNGLLCCTRQTEIEAEIDYDEIDYINFDWGSLPRPVSTYKTYIYNPTTRQYRCLPPSPYRDNGPPALENCFIEVCSISLAFDPIKSLDQHYKVVCIWSVEPCCSKDWDAEVHGKRYFEIYSSKTNSWRKLNSPFSIYLNGKYCDFSQPVYWNGCLHWIGNQDTQSSMYFDIKQELVKPLPASPTDTVKAVQPLKVRYFGECGDNLYLIELESCGTRFDILKMEIDYSSWKSIYRLDLERLVSLYPGNDPLEFHNAIYLYRVVLFLEEDEAESLSKLVVSVSGDKLVSYDLKEMSATEIHSCDDGRYYYLRPPVCGGIHGHVHHYIESLACV